jgi:hypothetical protein
MSLSSARSRAAAPSNAEPRAAALLAGATLRRVLEDRSRTIRFVGGHYDDPDVFDWECRLISRIPDRIIRMVAIGGIVLETLTDPPRTIRLQSRVVGKAIGAAETSTTTTHCTYAIDRADGDGDKGMALWDEDTSGNVIVRAFDYPG